jgi:hypothetical protein
MALVTTIYTFGWYGVDGSECSDKSIHDFIGEIVEGAYQGDFDSIKAKAFEVYGYNDAGVVESFSWTLHETEKASGLPTGTFQTLKELKCGRMYMIKNFKSALVDIPGLVPSASGVDMGRVVPA